MQNEYSQLNSNAIKNMKTYQNEDANAIAIDSMLVNLRLLLKKILHIKKIHKEITDRKQPFNQSEVKEKEAHLEEESKNLNLVFTKTIPPDKRMTNLFYMRIIKQIACYEKIIPSFSEILPRLESTYSQQVRSEQFSIMELYLICERKFIMEIKAVKTKIIQFFKDQTAAFLANQVHLQQSLIEKKENCPGAIIQNHGSTEFRHFDKFRLIGFSNPDSHVIDILLRNQYETKNVPKRCYKTVEEAIENASKSEIFLNFKERATYIFDEIYSPLDIESIQIVTLFLPTLRPEDNIDFIYQKVKNRSKKTRKQIREFQTEYALFAIRRKEMEKKKLKKQEFRRRGQTFSKERPVSFIVKQHQLSSKITQKISTDYEPDRSKLFQKRKDLLPSVQLAKQIPHQQNYNHRERSISRFRQRFEESLEQSKQISTAILKPSNLSPLVLNPQQKMNLIIKPKKKLAFEEPQQKQKENSPTNELEPIKKRSANKSIKAEGTVSRFGQKRGRSIKNKSNKEIVSRKLKL